MGTEVGDRGRVARRPGDAASRERSGAGKLSPSTPRARQIQRKDGPLENAAVDLQGCQVRPWLALLSRSGRRREAAAEPQLSLGRLRMARVKALEAREEFLSCEAGGISAPARDLPTIEAACLTCALVQLSHNGSEKGDGSKSFKAAASRASPGGAATWLCCWRLGRPPCCESSWSSSATLMAAESLFQYRVL